MEHPQGGQAAQLLNVIAAANPPPPPPPPRHTLTLVPSPKMDAQSLMAAVCACGSYTSGPSSRNHAQTSGLQHVAAAVLNDATTILTAGLAWLIDTVQPPGVLTQHHGVGRGTPDRWFRFIPSPTWPILAMSISHPAVDERGNLLNPLTRHDVVALRAAVLDRGHTIRSTWNGVGCDTVSVGLGGTTHPTLLDAVETYHRGCPEHRSVFCSPAENGCDWYGQGSRGLVPPAWPAPEVPR